MPCFLVPIHESNDCHNPAGPGGGQFCSSGGTAAHIVPHTASLPALAQQGDPSGRKYTRRFLFNPSTGRMIVGGASGLPGREQTHAGAHENAVGDTVPQAQRAKDYDRYSVHGHLMADTPSTGSIDSPVPERLKTGPLAIQIDRVVIDTPRVAFVSAYSTRTINDREVAESDALYEFYRYAAAHGATKTTKVWHPGKHAGTPLGKIHPELFPKRAARKKAA